MVHSDGGIPGILELLDLLSGNILHDLADGPVVAMTAVAAGRFRGLVGPV
jgi:hypothetical protein